MLGSAFLYPFGLLARRPVSLARWLGVSWLVLLVIDAAATLLGVDLIFSDEINPGYNLAGSIPMLFLFGALHAIALIDLGERPSDRPAGLADGAVYFVCGLIYSAIFLLPVVLAVGVVVAVTQKFAPEHWMPWAVYATGAISGCLVLWAVARMAFQAPLAIAEGRSLGYGAWSETRGKGLKILFSLLVLWGAGIVVAGGALMGLQYALDPYLATAPELTDPAMIADVVYLAGLEFIMVAVYYWCVATISFLFHRMRTRLSGYANVDSVSA